MTRLTIYHVGALEDVLTTVAAGSGIRWSTEMHDWLGHGIYFWEDISWAEWWHADCWHASKGVEPGAILAASIDTDLLLDLSSRSDADFFSRKPAAPLRQFREERSSLLMTSKASFSIWTAPLSTQFTAAWQIPESMDCECLFI